VSGSIAREGMGAPNIRERRMDTAPQYHLRFVCVVLFQFKMRNGMEEVVGSIPTRSTNSFPIAALSAQPLWLYLGKESQSDKPFPLPGRLRAYYFPRYLAIVTVAASVLCRKTDSP
jgi:hypothetical protein